MLLAAAIHDTIMCLLSICRYTKAAPDQPLIYRNAFKKEEVGNISHSIPGAIANDPTLAQSQNAKCPNFKHHEAVVFHSDVAQADSLALIFVSCNCAHNWVN
jgi:DNA-directed RNA polymerase subunit M/transcription elongation factor TFIIS